MSITVSSNTDSKEVVDAVNAVVAPKEKVVEQKKPVESTDDETDVDDESTELATAGEEDEVEDKTEPEIKPKKKGGFQKKLERKDQELSVKDQRIKALEAELLNKKPEKTDSKEPVIYGNAKKPVADDYDTHEQFVEALTDFKIEQKELKKEADKTRSDQESEIKKVGESYQSKLKEFKKITPDFDEVLLEIDDLKMVDAFSSAVIMSDIAPEIMYYLAKNPELAEKINGMTAFNIAKEIGKIELKLEKAAVAAEADDEKEEKTTTTKAPAPIKPVGSKGSAVPKKIDDPSLSQSEYEALRRKQQAAKPKY